MENKLETKIDSELISNLVLNGDISKMTDIMKVQYYNQLCHSLNLNPVTRPFQIISFQGKSVLYATKDCTEQLRKLNGVSVVELVQDIKSDMIISKCKVQDNQGRYDIATGVVNIAGVKGNDLANAIMKSETKSKRRATLSICGLGMLDESELDTMPKYETSDITKITETKKESDFCIQSINYLTTFTDEKQLNDAYKKIKSSKRYTGLDLTDKESIDKTYLDLLNKLKPVETSVIEQAFEVEEVKEVKENSLYFDYSKKITEAKTKDELTEIEKELEANENIGLKETKDLLKIIMNKKDKAKGGK